MNNPNEGGNRDSNGEYEEVESAPHVLLTPSPLPSTRHSVSDTLRYVFQITTRNFWLSIQSTEFMGLVHDHY